MRVGGIEFATENRHGKYVILGWSSMQQDKQRTLASECADEQLEETIDDKGLVRVSLSY